MIKITYSPVFQRKCKKLFKNIPSRQAAFQQKISLFLQNQFYPQLYTHKLSENLKEFYFFSIEYNLRMIFYFASEKEVVFDNIGSHDEVY